ncbi:MAG: hypothetical protein IJH79_09310 [Lentisphaeria bacterium]|nr:hypothetical protein [Lentisphaeria bacterium]
MKTLKSYICAAAALLAIFSLQAEEIIFDPLLTGWKKTSSKQVFADTEIKISKQCSVRLEKGGQLRRVFEVEPNSKYELTFYVKGKGIESGNNHGARIMLNSGKKWGRAVVNPKGEPDTGTFDWKKGRKIIDTSVFDSGKITLILAINGEGTVWYDALKLEKINAPAGKTNQEQSLSYSVKLFPQMFEKDGVSFCENLPAMLHIVTSGKGKYTGKTAKMTLDVPEFLEFRGIGETFALAQGRRQPKATVSEIVRDKVKYKRHEIVFSKEFVYWFGLQWFGHVIVMDPAVGSAGKTGRIYWSFDLGGEIQKEQSFTVKMLPPVKTAEKPCSRFALWVARLQAPHFKLPGRSTADTLKFWNSLSDRKYAMMDHPRDQHLKLMPEYDKIPMPGGNHFAAYSVAGKEAGIIMKQMPQDVKENGQKTGRVSVWAMVDDPDSIYEKYLRDVLRKIKKNGGPGLKNLIWEFEPHPYGFDEGGRKRFARKKGMDHTPSIEEINKKYANQWFDYMVKLHAEHIAKTAKIIREELPGVKFWLCSDNLHAAEPHVARWCGVDVALSDDVVDVHNHMPYYAGTRYFDDMAYCIAKLKKPYLPLIDPAERQLNFYRQYSAPKIEQNIVATAALGGIGIGFWVDDVMPGEYYHAIARGFEKVSKAEPYYFEGKRCKEDISVKPKNVISRKLPNGKEISYPDFSQTLRFTAHKLNGKYLVTVFNYDETRDLIAEVSGKDLKPFLVKVEPGSVVLAGTDFMPEQKVLEKEAAVFSGDASIFRDHISGKAKANWSANSSGLPVLQITDGILTAGVDAFNSSHAVSLQNAEGAELLTQGFCGRIIFADQLQPKLIFKRTAHGIAGDGTPYVTAEAEVGPYDGANSDPNPLYRLKIERKFEVSGGKLVISHRFSNPTGNVMPLKLRIGNFPWPGHRFDADKVTLNGKTFNKDQTFSKPEWNGGEIRLQADNGVLKESIVFEPDAKFTGFYSWVLNGKTPRKTVEFLIDQPLKPHETAEYRYSVIPEK